MGNEDTRWVQRLDNFNKALDQLKSGVELVADHDFNDLNTRKNWLGLLLKIFLNLLEIPVLKEVGMPLD